MTDKVRQRMSRCIEALEAVALRLGRNWRVSPFGSAANGFGTKFSDLDATCYELKETQDEEEEQKQPAEILSERLAPLLREHPEFTMAQEVLHARVPILKLCFEGELEVDLSCHNTLPLQNTKLLKAYSSLDERIRDLVITVKLWAKANGVCGASQSHLSSYALTLMAIYFMQVHPKIRLVMLPVAVFKEDGNADEAEQKVEAARGWWTCSLSLGQMVLRFFQFYSQEFDWGREVVTVRIGQRRSTNDSVLIKLKGRNCQRLHVEDPVDESRNLNCVLGEMQENHLMRTIQDTYLRLQKQHSVRFGLPLSREAKEEPSAEGEPASSPVRPIRVYDHLSTHLPTRQERMPAPSAVEALSHPGTEVTPNTRTHSLSEASTAASCASSTDEATNENQDHVGAHAADTGAYFEAPTGGASRGHRHAKESRNGRQRGTEAYWLPETMDKGYAHTFGLHPEVITHQHFDNDQGQKQGKELLQLLHINKPDVPAHADAGCARPPPPPPLPISSVLPQMPQMAQSYTSLKTGQPVSSTPTVLPAAAPPSAEQQAPPVRNRATRNIMAKVKSTCEAHNQTEEKVWQ